MTYDAVGGVFLSRANTQQAGSKNNSYLHYEKSGFIRGINI